MPEHYPAEPLPVVHYAPYGKNAAGRFSCGSESGGYTERPANVTCAGCKAESPGLWPADERSLPLDQDGALPPPKGTTLADVLKENQNMRLGLLRYRALYGPLHLEGYFVAAAHPEWLTITPDDRGGLTFDAVDRCGS